jgi:hypothetical protein
MTTSNKREAISNDVMQSALVDALASVKARIAALQAEEEVLKSAIIAQGERVLLGTEHRATVSECEGRITTDWKAVATRLNASRQLIAAHTTQGDAYTVVRLSAHKTA